MAWHITSSLGDGVYIASHRDESGVRHAPLVVHSFVLPEGKRLAEALDMLEKYPAYESINNVPDRLKWLRLHAGLTQSEVAAFVGLSEAGYMEYENGGKEAFDRSVVDRLAALYGRLAGDFLDEYNRFLYNGQVEQLSRLRAESGLCLPDFARSIGVPETSFSRWERGIKRMNRKSWERYIKPLKLG